MPDALADNRIALDEPSLDFRHLSSEELQEHLDILTETMQELRRAGLTVWVHPEMWTEVHCLDGIDLATFLFTPEASSVNRDTLRLLARLLDRCPSWQEDEPGYVSSVTITSADDQGGDGREMVLDLGFSLGVLLHQDRRMACLTFGPSRRGIWTLSDKGVSRQAYFFGAFPELCRFWRWLYTAEDIQEDDFFTLAGHAFPALEFHPALKFGAFVGSYFQLRDTVVRILGVLNDHFAEVMGQHSGLPHQVQAALGAHGVNLSPESPRIRGSDKLMAQRTVTFNGDSYVCEWHAKLAPDRNRIHFSLPDQRLDGKILIGIFTEHLDT